MTQTIMITDEQLTQIKRHAVNQVTRDLAKTGARLTFDQLDELDEPTIAWLRVRLGLRTVANSGDVELVPSEITAQDRYTAVEDAAPLVKVARLYFGCSDESLDHDGWGEVFGRLATHLASVGEDVYRDNEWSEADEGCQITAPVARIQKIKAAIESFDGPVYCEVDDAS